ncbi:alpha/beta hydrolase [Pseudonocardia sp. ICBG1034]|uniref:PHA/PHB synthase family protein n=1 Tax=Pseudonocardia sp. ICBG1034 TaxID=2844381 RepID=UPI001CCDF2FC|nr:alpha/beta fold hydrolase [Pseudonocardia sp. ICBG1034]
MNMRRDGGPEPEDTAELGAPLDLLLTRAAGGLRHRVGPSTSTAKLLVGLAARPRPVARRAGALAAELGRVALGVSDVAPGPRDRRFADPAWSTNPMLRRTLQAYLATSSAAREIVEQAGLDPHDATRVRAGVSNLIDALAPSNNPVLNPEALRAIVDTAGTHFLRGARNLVRDMAEPPRVPRMVEPDAFVVGETVAATPGQVVARTPQYELIRYTPTTTSVREYPLVIVPPVINKYYVVDMAPGRSLVEYLVGEGHQVFVMSWRNPDVRHASWGLDVYGTAVLEALTTARSLTRAPRALVHAFCSGGIIASMALAHLAAGGGLDTVAGLGLSVAVLDQQDTGLTGELLTPAAAEAAVRASAARGYLDGRALAEVFAWLRPNDLVWNYWVSSYLLGRSPAPFDVLFWNADTTRMTAALHRGFVEIARDNALTRPGGATLLGTPVDLAAVTVDSYVTAGVTDHICPWQACYRSTDLLGGSSRFVLSSAGHVASIVNPPSSTKASFWTAAETPVAAEDWHRDAERVQGSWWPDLSRWLHARSGDEVDAPTESGNAEYPVLEPAPGTYVHTT